jgi:hypothetical protein
MKILGYSERGAVNALLYEIAYRADSVQLLERLLDRARFAGNVTCPRPIKDATVLVEQSLSDFGDADAILLLDGPVRAAVFVEAKVRNAQAASWTLADECTAFQAGLATQVSSSNLFTQLYHKVRFVDAALSEGQRALHAGARFSDASTKRLRRIGKNPVVLRAVEAIMPYLPNALYLGVVPDTRERVDSFLTGPLSDLRPGAFECWDTSRWGFMCWADIRAFCEAEGLRRSLAVLDFNREQIYRR